MVSGSSIYKVSITIAAVPKPQWQSICRDCSGGIDSLVELLQGRLSKAVMERLCRQDRGLFPRPSEIRFKCSCPDSASMCKHIAAVLYGVGSRLDQQPELLFRLRSVNEKDLLPDLDRALPLSKTGPAAGRVLAGDDLSALFDLDLAGGEVGGAPMPPEPPSVKVATAKKAASAASRKKDVAAKKAAPNVTESGRLGITKPPHADPEEEVVAAAQEKQVQAAIKLVQSAMKTSKSAQKRKKTVQPGLPARERNAVWDPSDIYTSED
jgi:uncharacterized Zn finger protein